VPWGRLVLAIATATTTRKRTTATATTTKKKNEKIANQEVDEMMMAVVIDP
jgi:hypothetical protein